jgi:hypothetical protein
VDIVLISASSFVCLEAVIRRDGEIHRSIGLPRDHLDRRLDLDQEVVAVVPYRRARDDPTDGARGLHKRLHAHRTFNAPQSG